MISKDFTTIEQQIDILKKRGLKFASEETAAILLRRFGYYNIINGYKEPYTVTIDGQECYKDGITFEQIYSLYDMDCSIRNNVVDASLEFEENLRTALSYVLGENFTSDESKYLDRENFRLGKKRKNGYQLDEILNKFDKVRNDPINPFKHYREKYNNLPPWILLKGASFGNLVNFFKLQKSDIKDEVVSIMYNIPKDILKTTPEIKDLFSDTTFVCLDYRNKAAHGGRIYNFNSKSTFRYNKLLHPRSNITKADYRKGSGKTGLPILIESLRFCDNKSPVYKLIVAIQYFCNKHLDIYPADANFLEEHLNYTKYSKDK